MTPDAFVELLGREKASAILRTNDQEKAAKATTVRNALVFARPERLSPSNPSILQMRVPNPIKIKPGLAKSPSPDTME